MQIIATGASYRSAVTLGIEESHIAAISSRKSTSLSDEIRLEIRVCNYCGTTLTQSHPLGCHPQEGTKGLVDSHKQSYLVTPASLVNNVNYMAVNWFSF
jgi:hypothetical protein